MSTSYRGTDPLEDAQLIFKERVDRLHGKDDLLDNSEPEDQSSNPDFPFEDYGLGITSYFRLIKVLAQVFAIISLIGGIPAAILYSTQNGYDETDKGLFKSLMVGNMGESYHDCQSKFFGYGHDPELKCKTGKITELAHAGIVPYSEVKEPKGGRGDKGGNRGKGRMLDGDEHGKKGGQPRIKDIKIDFCGNPVGINEKVEKCSKLFDEEKFREDFEKICAGKKSCKMNLPTDLQ